MSSVRCPRKRSSRFRVGVKPREENGVPQHRRRRTETRAQERTNSTSSGSLDLPRKPQLFEPPDADPPVRWCGRGPGKSSRAPMPIVAWRAIQQRLERMLASRRSVWCLLKACLPIRSGLANAAAFGLLPCCCLSSLGMRARRCRKRIHFCSQKSLSCGMTLVLSRFGIAA
jgi:hypothetical protein